MWTANDIASLKIANVTDDEMRLIRATLSEWNARYGKNVRRSLYFDTEQALKDLGIAVPPKLRNAKRYLGWATQAVRKPAMRSQFDKLTLPGSEDPFELGEILDANQWGLQFSEANVAAGTHGVAFTSITKGGDGEPDVLFHSHSAEFAAGLYDARLRALRCAVTLSDLVEDRPSKFIAYLPNVILHCSKPKGGRWQATRLPSPSGRVQCVAIPCDPQLRRPLGRSRITNAVMTLNDMAVRTLLRMEVNAEIYSFPQLVLLGVAEDAFGGEMKESEKFKIAMDRFLALTKDEDGDKPELKQLTQASMTPHQDMLRSIAMAFTGETGIPPNSLGVLHDQPASAEAIRAAEHDLLIDVTYQNKYPLNQANKDIATLAVMVRDGLSEPPAEAWKLNTTFVDPEFRSLSAQADAVQKLSSDMGELTNWPVLLEQIFDDDQVERLLEEKRRQATVSSLDSLIGSQVQDPTAEANAIKAKFDALGVAIRSGVDPDNAAQLVGLDGVEFTGAIPVSLRPPADEAADLEDK